MHVFGSRGKNCFVLTWPQIYFWNARVHGTECSVNSFNISGTPNGCTLRLNILHLQNGLYGTIGRMMSTIIVQGGEPPAFMSPSVVDYIVSGDILQVHVTPDDIGRGAHNFFNGLLRGVPGDGVWYSPHM